MSKRTNIVRAAHRALHPGHAGPAPQQRRRHPRPPPNRRRSGEERPPRAAIREILRLTTITPPDGRSTPIASGDTQPALLRDIADGRSPGHGTTATASTTSSAAPTAPPTPSAARVERLIAAGLASKGHRQRPRCSPGSRST